MSKAPNTIITSHGLLEKKSIKEIEHAYSGFLFVGDPHLTCVAPGTRNEKGLEFLDVVADKLAQARHIAEQNNLFIVFLGDVTNNSTAKKDGTSKVVENSNVLLSRFAQAMAFRECVTMSGNHDKDETVLTEDTTLATMRALRLIDVIDQSGPYGIFNINGAKVGLGGTPYKEEIPKDVTSAFDKPTDNIVWITHSLFVFDQQIPKVEDPPEIIGCDLLVNGHDHTTQKPRQMGQTLCFNPGNITRMSRDHADHVPSVWQWDPENGIKQHILKYNPGAFNMIGHQVKADVKSANKLEIAKSSQFANLLRIDGNADLPRSSSADMLEEDIQRIAAERKVGATAALILKNLLNRAPEKLKPH